MFSIYQNPLEGKVYIDLEDNSSSTSYKIVNANGQIVKKRNKLRYRNTILFSMLPEGMYTIEVKTKNKVTTKKFLKF